MACYDSNKIWICRNLEIVDGCESVLNAGKTEPVSLLEVLNSMLPAIIFKIEVSESNLLFHDVLIHNDGSQISVDMYSEPTDSKGYSPFSFNYPKNCLKHTLCIVKRTRSIV